MNDNHLQIVNDDRYRQAELLLRRRSLSGAGRLRDRLHLVQQRQDLTWRRLIAEQRAIQAHMGSGYDQPSIWKYWDNTANPTARPLFDDASAVIDEELTLVVDAAVRFAQTARRVGVNNVSVLTRSIRDAVSVIEGAGLAAEPLNEIGARWQKRLHRAAVRKASLSILMAETSQAEMRIIQAEMALLETAPWAHMDRLLMAFEFTHSDVRCHLRDQLDCVTDEALAAVDQTNEFAMSAQRVVGNF